MKFTTIFRNLSMTGALLSGLCLGHAAWGKPSIQQITVSPNPLAIAQNFTVTVAASPDVTQATAVLNFLKGTPEYLEVRLSKQGSNWVGSGVVPLELRFADPHKAEAKVKVLVLDAALRSAELIVRLPVNVPDIAAVFAGGVLTITGDDQDNTIVASLDASGTILVNGGAVPVGGGIPSVTNTTLIRILGAGGNDVLQVSDFSGLMPPSNLMGEEGDDTLFGSASADVLDGGPGNDTLSGGRGNDTLFGGIGADTLMGGQGEDVLVGGEGDDEFVWNPGDTSDVIEGEDGNDTLVFNGSNVGEIVDLSANGARLRFFRNIAGAVMDCDGIERVLFRALGGADQVVVNDLTGTDVAHVIVDLLSSNGTGDAQADVVYVNGTETNDVLMVSGSTNGVNVLGSAAAVTVLGAEPAQDQLVINALAGIDVVDASAVEANVIGLTLNGGLGSDTLTGSQGGDVLIGGRDNDTVSGGAGDDTFPWNPGDGSDVIEGQAGYDTLLFNGANVSETVEISAVGQRIRFTRNIATITMDCNEVETIQYQALGGADMVTVNDLSGTGVVKVNIDWRAAGSPAGDTQPDTLIVNGTAGDDVVTVAGGSAGLSVSGLAATVNIFGSEGALDRLIVQLLGGDDVATAESIIDGLINLTLNGGLGGDVLIGSAGADVLLGDEGDDVLLGGPGVDLLDGGTGNNIVIQD
jgi:Ca2+-binding RTX toxin-like protein